MAGRVSFHCKGCQPPDKWWQKLKNNESHSRPLPAKRWLLNSPMYCSIKSSTGLQSKTHQSVQKNKAIGLRNIFICGLAIKTLLLYFNEADILRCVHWARSKTFWDCLILSSFPNTLREWAEYRSLFRLWSPLFPRVCEGKQSCVILPGTIGGFVKVGLLCLFSLQDHSDHTPSRA